MNNSLECSGNDTKLDTRLKMYAEYKITEREREIIELIIKGHNNKEIGSILNISKRTVSKHLENIYFKFKVNNRIALVKELFI